MFDMKLVDIGGDGLVVECQTDVETLSEAEILITASINQHLGITNTRLVHIEDLTYDVLVNGHESGLAVIRSL